MAEQDTRNSEQQSAKDDGLCGGTEHCDVQLPQGVEGELGGTNSLQGAGASHVSDRRPKRDSQSHRTGDRNQSESASEGT